MTEGKNGLVRIIDSIKLEEPILITPEIDTVLTDTSSLDYNGIYCYDKETKNIESRKLFSTELKIVYARRLLTALYFCNHTSNHYAQRDTAFAYDKAGTMAHALAKVDHDIKKSDWTARSMIVRSRSAALNSAMGNKLDAFFSYVFSAESGLELLKYGRSEGSNTQDIPNWSQERISDNIKYSIEQARAIFDKGLDVRNQKIMQAYRHVQSSIQEIISQV